MCESLTFFMHVMLFLFLDTRTLLIFCMCSMTFNCIFLIEICCFCYSLFCSIARSTFTCLFIHPHSCAYFLYSNNLFYRLFIDSIMLQCVTQLFSHLSISNNGANRLLTWRFILLIINVIWYHTIIKSTFLSLCS